MKFHMIRENLNFLNNLQTTYLKKGGGLEVQLCLNVSKSTLENLCNLCQSMFDSS